MNTSGIVLYLAVHKQRNLMKHVFGIHGYIFNKDNKLLSPIPASHGITATGYALKTDIKKQNIETVRVEEYIDIAYNSNVESNSELLCIIEAFNYVAKKLADTELSTITIHTNSSYLQRIVDEFMPKCVERNWNNTNDNTIPHIKDLLLFYDLYTNLSKKSNVQIIHNETGMDGCGYHQANIMANVGEYSPNNTTLVKSTEAKIYWKYDNNRHPLFYSKKLILTHNTSDIPNKYYLVSTKEEHDIGKYVNDSSYAIVYTNTPVEPINTLQEYLNKIAMDNDMLLSVNLDILFQAQCKKTIDICGINSFNTGQTRVLSVIIAANNQKIAGEIYPAGLSLQSIHAFSFLEELMEQYKTKDNKLFCADITNSFYVGSKLKTDICVGYRQHKISVAHKDKHITIPLILGLDLPARNQLKQLEPILKSIELITWVVSDYMLRYACVVKTTDAIGIWTNNHTNSVLV